MISGVRQMKEQLKKVLVVDDDQSVVAFVSTALSPEPPDLIILDVYMPRQPGFYTLRDLKDNPKTKEIPVIMLTGIGKRLGIAFSTQDIYDSLGIEPDVYLEKPVDPMYLQQVTDRLLGMSSAAKGSPMGNE
jgi:CheY-like chemotaxis protein